MICTKLAVVITILLKVVVDLVRQWLAGEEPAYADMLNRCQIQKSRKVAFVMVSKWMLCKSHG